MDSLWSLLSAFTTAVTVADANDSHALLIRGASKLHEQQLLLGTLPEAVLHAILARLPPDAAACLRRACIQARAAVNAHATATLSLEAHPHFQRPPTGGAPPYSQLAAEFPSIRALLINVPLARRGALAALWTSDARWHLLQVRGRGPPAAPGSCCPAAWRTRQLLQACYGHPQGPARAPALPCRAPTHGNCTPAPPVPPASVTTPPPDTHPHPPGPALPPRYLQHVHMPLAELNATTATALAAMAPQLRRLTLSLDTAAGEKPPRGQARRIVVRCLGRLLGVWGAVLPQLGAGCGSMRLPLLALALAHSGALRHPPPPPGSAACSAGLGSPEPRGGRPAAAAAGHSGQGAPSGPAAAPEQPAACVPWQLPGAAVAGGCLPSRPAAAPDPCLIRSAAAVHPQQQPP